MLFANPEFQSGFDLLWDRSLAHVDPDWTWQDVARLAERYSLLRTSARGAPAREAVVVARNDTLTFGLTRMFQMQTDDARREGELRIVETRAEADA